MASDNCFSRDKPTASGDAQRAEEGFTLVELISVVAIIAILAAIAIPFYDEYINTAKIKGRAIPELLMLEQEIDIYKIEEGHLPDTLGDIRQGDLKDPWGTPYQYLRIEGNDNLKGKGDLRKDGALNPLNKDYDLYSMGKDRKTQMSLNAKDSKDDIVRAIDGGYVGLAEKF